MVSAAIVRISRPVRPGCWAEASRRTPTSRPGLGRSANCSPLMVAVPDVGTVRPTMTRMVVAGTAMDAHVGRLAGAVRPEEAGDATRAYGEGDGVDGRVAAVPLGELVYEDHVSSLRGSAAVPT